MCKLPENISETISEMQITQPKRIKSPKGWGVRHTFLLLGFLGFVLVYALRFNLSIAIVKMVQDSKSTSKEYVNGTVIKKTKICPKPDAPISGSYNPAEELDEDEDDEVRFDWNDEQQGLVLGSFFWGYVLTQYPGGKLSQVYGPKHVLSLAILLTGLLSMAIPIVTINFDVRGLTVVRFLQGLTEGLTLPSILVMLTHWAPAEERGRMTNWIYAGVPIGTASTMVAGGYLIHFWGWPSVFYVTGALSLIWFVFWVCLTYNDPSEHPSISAEELKYIKSHLKGEEIPENIPTPWMAILKSLPVWAILIADLGDSWAHYLLHVQVPMYLNAVHGFDIKKNGWFSAFPQISNCIFALSVAYISDFVIRKKYSSVICTRKICATIALWGSAAGFVGMLVGGCNTAVAVTSLIFAAGIKGAGNSAWIVNHIEVAPNHAGTVSGVANSVGNVLGFICPWVNGLILQYNPNLNGWKIALAIPAIISFSVNIFYLTFADAKEQPWNKPKEKKTTEHV